jgi:hypothetical protein
MSVFDVVRELDRRYGKNPDGSAVNRVKIRYNDGSGSTIKGVILGIPEDTSPESLRKAAVTFGVIKETREHSTDEVRVDSPSMYTGAAAGVFMDALCHTINRISDIPQIEGGMIVQPTLPPGDGVRQLEG